MKLYEKSGKRMNNSELVRKSKRNWLATGFRRNCLLKDALEGMMNERKIQGRRRFQMITLR